MQTVIAATFALLLRPTSEIPNHQDRDADEKADPFKGNDSDGLMTT
jgi:hypothetical protein